jgi:hypothetical protein
MSLSIYQGKADKLRADIATLRKKLAQEKDKEARKTKEYTTTTRSLAKTKSTSTFKMKQNKANRLMGEIAKIQKGIASLEGQIASKTKDLHNAEQRVSKEQAKSRAAELRHERALTQEANKRRHLEDLRRRLAIEFPEYEASPHEEKYDVFISHASRDKDDFVEPLAELLREMGFRVWYDSFVLTAGDSLRESIDKGIRNSEYGLVVLSPSFIARSKGWTERELNGLTAREVAGRVTLVTLGPLSNIAAALIKAPHLATQIEQCYVMGGAANTIGNISPAAEYNIWCDPEAARIVFHSGMPILMIGHEHSLGDAVLTPAELEDLRSMGGLARFAVECNAAALRASTEWLHEAGLTQPDPVAMSVALDPTICTVRERHYVNIETHSELTRGMTVVDRFEVLKQQPNIDVCYAIDVVRWKNVLKETFKN